MWPTSPPAPDPATRVDAPPPSDYDERQDDFSVPAVGSLVTVTHFDTATLADVTRHGIVVDVVDLGAGTGVRVAWLPEVSDPIPLDPAVTDRVDAPRVARVEV